MYRRHPNVVSINEILHSLKIWTCFFCRDEKIIISINNIKTKLCQREASSYTPNYMERKSESHADILKSTDCQQRGHVLQILLVIEKGTTASQPGQPVPATVCVS